MKKVWRLFDVNRSSSMLKLLNETVAACEIGININTPRRRFAYILPYE